MFLFFCTNTIKSVEDIVLWYHVNLTPHVYFFQALLSHYKVMHCLLLYFIWFQIVFNKAAKGNVFLWSFLFRCHICMRMINVQNPAGCYQQESCLISYCLFLYEILSNRLCENFFKSSKFVHEEKPKKCLQRWMEYGTMWWRISDLQFRFLNIGFIHGAFCYSGAPLH